MKYRPLHKEELESLQDDFVKFLASNSVTASDWTELKSNDPSKAEQLIGVFSEIVWEKVLGNIKFMRHRFASEMRVYKFDEESATAVVLRLGKSGVDFTDADDVKKLAAGKLDLSKYDPEILHGTRNYRKPRKEEIFELMEMGARPCNEAFWRSITRMLPDQYKS
ncbi:MAG: hypothetical protein KDC12_03265 [Flavobacteriales bacterium]|nr:hypothetical protein [Flavobacteriales bacterium]